MVAVSLASASAAFWWAQQPMELGGRVADLSIEPGTTARGVAQLVVNAGVQTSPQLLYWWFRLSGQARQITAGSYELEGSVTPYSLLTKLVRGDEALRAVTLVEGFTFKQVLQSLQKEELLTHDTQGLEPYLIMQKWLSHFAYSIELSWYYFIISGLAVFFIAIVTVSIQAWQTASRNPVDVLRYK